ncbi:hypothetical protein [Streptomyces sp. NBC_00273]|uniref:hypothetical protein n=1 Tax=Streptomyces sp. NBC_00273 TaxID=2903644 RepID=UPI002E28DAE8|nr:hypothetical protein [Streptomyces sp. NBC_00273]
MAGKVTLGKAIRTLEEHFAYSTTSWSEFRSGSRLPSEDLLKAVVERYVTEPEMRDRQKAEGLRLLAAAKKAEAALVDTAAPEPAPLPVPVARGTDEVAKALLRLDDARMRQIEALEKLASSERQRAQLENMVSILQERCTVLEVERDRAREDVRAELESELQISREYRRQADEKLEHARRAEEKAYQLRLAAEEQVSRERLAVNSIDDRANDSAPEPSAASPDYLGLPPLEQIRDVLQAAQEQLEAQDDELDDLEDLIGVDPAPRAPLSRRDPWVPHAGPKQPKDYLFPEPQGPQQNPDGTDQTESPVVPEQPQDNPNYLMTEPATGDFFGMPSRDDKTWAPPPRDLAEGAVPPKEPDTQPGQTPGANPGLLAFTKMFGDRLTDIREQAKRSWTDEEISSLIFSGFDEQNETKEVASWFAGTTMPTRRGQLSDLLNILGATRRQKRDMQEFWTAAVDSEFPPKWWFRRR